jgi:hypothetical protein
MITLKHKVFVSYHHDNDQYYRNLFEGLFSSFYNILVSKSVQIGDIDPNLKTETIRQKIRDEYLKDSTVTVVLIGTETWKRKHVDWEIGSSIRSTNYNSRSGLLGIFLPSYPLKFDSKEKKWLFNNFTIPPRLYYNWIEPSKRFAQLYKWSDDPSEVQRWIHIAFEDRNKIIPDNSYPPFVNNRSGDCWSN